MSCVDSLQANGRWLLRQWPGASGPPHILSSDKITGRSPGADKIRRTKWARNFFLSTSYASALARRDNPRLQTLYRPVSHLPSIRLPPHGNNKPFISQGVCQRQKTDLRLGYSPTIRLPKLRPQASRPQPWRRNPRSPRRPSRRARPPRSRRLRRRF